MKINSNIILAILGFFAIRWYLGNRNKLDNNFQPQIVVDPTLSTTTDWHDGLIMITNNNGGNFYVDISENEYATNSNLVNTFIVYNDQQQVVHTRDYFTISGLPLPASNTYININNGFLADGSNYSAMLLDGSYYDLSTFQEVYRGCLDINDPNYLSTNLYQIPSIDCANYNGDNSYYNI
tara:strand:+ start:355 stop:894 length:540 start_codon:yes stop_codon:yes gene_type:complete